MKSLKIIVTGGNGFIGRHLIKRLAGLGYKVTFLDNLSASGERGLPKTSDFIKQDISQSSLTGIFLKIKPDIVFHLAAENRVVSPVASTLQNNVIGTFNVLESSRAVKIKQVIFSSSAAVYGDAKQLPIDETFPVRPISAYGISKLAGELYCQLFRDFFTATVFRFANVYGPGQNSSAEGGAVAIFIKQILANQPITVYGDGSQTRDFVFVDDVVDALVAAISQPLSGPFNIGTNKKVSVNDLIDKISYLTGIKAKITKRPKRPMEIDHSLFSYSAVKAKLDWRPKTDLETGLKQTINWFKS